MLNMLGSYLIAIKGIIIPSHFLYIFSANYGKSWFNTLELFGRLHLHIIHFFTIVNTQDNNEQGCKFTIANNLRSVRISPSHVIMCLYGFDFIQCCGPCCKNLTH